MSVKLYGEDGLTMWALCKKLPDIFAVYGLDDTILKQVFYRPSFGRGGKIMCHIGEFDFIIALEGTLILGESKWSRNDDLDVSPHGHLSLDTKQSYRHKMFEVWCSAWWDSYSRKAELMRTFSANNDDSICEEDKWLKFIRGIEQQSKSRGIESRKPTRYGRVFKNFHYIMGQVDSINLAPERPKVRNLLLYFADSEPANKAVKYPPEGFELLRMNYDSDKQGEFVSIFGA